MSTTRRAELGKSLFPRKNHQDQDGPTGREEESLDHDSHTQRASSLVSQEMLRKNDTRQYPHIRLEKRAGRAIPNHLPRREALLLPPRMEARSSGLLLPSRQNDNSNTSSRVPGQCYRKSQPIRRTSTMGLLSCQLEVGSPWWTRPQTPAQRKVQRRRIHRQLTPQRRRT